MSLPLNTVLGSLELGEVFVYYDRPCLFVCTSKSGQVWLASAADEDDDGWETWLYVQVSTDRLNAIRSGRITLRDAYVSAEDGVVCKVLLEATTGLATVEPLKASAIPDEWLAEEGERLELEPRGEAIWERAVRSNREVVELVFETAHGGRSEVPAADVGGVLTRFQSTVDVLRKPRRLKKAHPRPASDETQLMFSTTFPGSLGIRLMAWAPADLFGDSPLHQAVTTLGSLIRCGGDTDAIKGALEELRPWAASRYRDFLRAVVSSRKPIKLEWASRTGADVVEMSPVQAQIALAAVEVFVQEDPVEHQVRARLVAANLRLKSYEIEADDGKRYSGRMLEDAFATVEGASLGSWFMATLVETVEIVETTQVRSSKFALVWLEPLSPDDQGDPKDSGGSPEAE